MQYEVHAVEGAASPRFRREPDVNNVVDEIEQVYAMAARRGGQVIAGHSLVCDWPIKDSNEQEVPTRIDYLFLVMELPDDTDQE